ncbi:hypothetical protein DEU56DRAFT_920533 [Suillus clintonianus]|uniref:uncharacterized protein n=1 Tax=Suillus clintonianus TaxID=1904413 RepID=UPI001B879C73|nr:uncharacterized protein DEU56DRAFT_920533 [Suillus clintonianus]KAG2107881.1 hypothetical protein DEU56DRAFT_920533 [Suillus clintonianus]
MDLPAKVVLVPFLAECALSEKDEHVFGKVEKVVLARPDIKCAVVVLVREDTDYAAPDDDSIASTVLRGGTSSDPRLLTQEDFLNLRTTHVHSGDDAPINVRSKDPAHTAYGTLVPTVMDSVTNMLDKGLTKIKDSIVTLQQKLAPDLDFTVLAETPIQSFFDWSRASRRILTAAEITAYDRYCEWHVKLFGESDSESSYAPSEQTDDSVEEEMADAQGSKRKRASTSDLPSSRFKIPKAA